MCVVILYVLDACLMCCFWIVEHATRCSGVSAHSQTEDSARGRAASCQEWYSDEEGIACVHNAKNFQV